MPIINFKDKIIEFKICIFDEYVFDEYILDRFYYFDKKYNKLATLIINLLNNNY
jgi:hypothetical protein